MIKYGSKMKEIAKEDMRDGLIPRYEQVYNRFKLGQLSPSDQELVHAFCRAQIWFAEKGIRDNIEPKKPKRLMHAISPQLDVLESDETLEALKTSLIEDPDFEALFENQEFLDFEEGNRSFLNMIALYIRGPIEKKRRLLKERQMPARK